MRFDLIVPAAGIGRRCRPWSATRPKPLLPIAGRPMLAHVLDELLPLGPARIVLITGFLGEQIEAWTRATYPGIELVTVRQDRLLGQSHAVLRARDHLTGAGLIVFPDMLFRLDPASLAALDPAIDGAVFTASVADRAGFAITATGPDGLVTRLVEKPLQPMPGDPVIGMYWLRDMPRLIAAIETQIALGRAAPGGEYALADAIGLTIEDGAQIATLPLRDWIGAGNNAALLAANRWALTRMAPGAFAVDRPDSVIIQPCAIHPTAVLERSVVGPCASIGAGVVVRDSVVRDSIVDDGARIVGAVLAGSLIGRRATVAGRARSWSAGDDATAYSIETSAT
ncbi:MAG: nucleotidyltransferase family protein [Thermomicrobiales bacterium]